MNDSVTQKRSISAFVLTAFICILAGCSNAQPPQVDAPTPTSVPLNEKVLIVYLTRTGNTEVVATMIQNGVGGDLVSLEVENPYPKDYQATVDQVAGENKRRYLPPLKTKIANIRQYDTIFVGAPTWGMQLPPPMKSFLNGTDLTGKTVVPFNTNAGYGSGSSFQQVRQFCRGCNVLEGFEVKGGIERDGILFVMEGEKEKEVRAKVSEWLSRLGIQK